MGIVFRMRVASPNARINAVLQASRSSRELQIIKEREQEKIED